jgi:hypothetical protein
VSSTDCARSGIAQMSMAGMASAAFACGMVTISPRSSPREPLMCAATEAFYLIVPV